jgi:flagellum-specific ATP synthase
MNSNEVKSNISRNLAALRKCANTAIQLEGRVTRAVGLSLEAVGFHQPVGSRCWVIKDSNEKIEAEVVGFTNEKSYLMCIGHTQGIAPGMSILPTGKVAEVGVSQQLLGRVLNGAGMPIDGFGTIFYDEYYPLVSKPINPLHREPIRQTLDVGVRAINGMLSVGRGQRMGLFAGSGVGKSVLLSMMTKFTEADVIVVGLIGERGREVREFIEQNLGEEGLRRSVIVAAPADESPLMRLHGAMVATTIAEYFRNKGNQVLLLMDSLTRFAQAQREIALSIGEPPATKGYPPSVFAKLPQLVERAGNGNSSCGGITAFYTVLTEGDDPQDPIADSARAILDGHIILSRSLAESGQFPAIDIESSISRVMPNIATDTQLEEVITIKKCMSLYEKNKDLVNLGVYVSGSDPNLDKAIALRPLISSYLGQNLDEKVTMQASLEQLKQVCAAINMETR